MLNTVPGLFLALDHESLVISAFGDAWETVGKQPEALVGQNFAKIKDTPFKQRHIQACREKKDTISVVTPHGARQFECTYKWHPGDGVSGSSVICYARDKTQEMRLDQHMIESNLELSAMARTRSLEELATAVAHEINNPLTIISGHTNALRMLIKKGNLKDDTGETHFNAVLRNVGRISKIVRSLRDVAEDGNNETARTLSLEDVVRRALENATQQMDAAGIRVTVSSDTGDSNAFGRDFHMVQAIEQLILNSLAAVRDLKEKWITIKITESGDSLAISVTDSGNGIPKDLHHKIMLPFFTTREVGEGSGIGLSIAKRNVEANAGSLILDPSSPNTRFVIKLPKSKVSQAS